MIMAELVGRISNAKIPPKNNKLNSMLHVCLSLCDCDLWETMNDGVF